MRTGIATFGLDYGRCPPWLFERMRRLAHLLIEAMVYEYGPETVVERLSDPFFFQSFGTILAFDWDASGLTTTTTGAIKEALRGTEKTLGIFVAGGKGKTSRKTPDDITTYSERFSIDETLARKLVYSSKISAKVDNSAVQDGFMLYHHSFFFTPIKSGSTKDAIWTVVQQGMNTEKGRARRYHWHSKRVYDFLENPHSGINDTVRLDNQKTLNLVAKESKQTKEVSTGVINNNFSAVLKDLRVLDYVNFPFARGRLLKSLYNAHVIKPKNFEHLLSLKGIGPKTVRALSLVSEIIYGAKPSYEDPARYSYAHGGKDGIPYPVDVKTYDQTLKILERAVQKARLGYLEKKKANQKLDRVRLKTPKVPYATSSA